MMERWLRTARGVLIALPALVAAALVWRYGIDVPFWDQWELVPLLERHRDGTLTAADLFAQHNEHRMAVPRLAMIGLADLTAWDIRAELALNLLLAAASLAVALAMFRPLTAGAGAALRLWLPFAVSAVLFSLTQYDNWLCGWQLQWFLSLLGALMAVWLLARGLDGDAPWPALAGAILAAGAVQFSFAGGTLLWPAGLLMIVLHPRPGRGRLALVWTTAAAGVLALHFIGWDRTLGDPSGRLDPLDDPLRLYDYMGAYLSGPLARGLGLKPVTAGRWLIPMFAVTAVAVLVTGWRRRGEALPWLTLAAFAAGNAFVTGLGRAGGGANQGASSRYVTIGLLFTLALLALVRLLFRRLPASRWRTAAATGLALGMTVLVIAADVRAVSRAAVLSERQRAGRDCLIAMPPGDDACLEKLYPVAGVVRERLPALERFGWGGLADRPVTDRALSLTADPNS